MTEKTKVETYLSPSMLRELRERELAKGRPDHEIIEEALADYLSAGRLRGTAPDLFERITAYQKFLGTPELSEEEAMELANAEVHGHREEHPEIHPRHASTWG